MLESATIKIFLVNGHPNGLRTAELSNWTGKAIAAPRTEINDLLKRDELVNPGIYLLTGVDEDSGDRTIYIGEAENVSKRLKNHTNRDFWSSITAFISKDGNLTKAHIRYLEGKLINRANEAGAAIVMNSTSSGAKLPESDTAEMDIFLDKIFALLPILGISHFNKVVERPSQDKGLLHCSVKELMATGTRTSNGFVVFAGSQAVEEHRPSADIIRRIRDRLLDKGVLSRDQGCLIFTKDYEFGSPSTAGGVVRGGNTNGLTAWKNAGGKNLKDIELN